MHTIHWVIQTFRHFVPSLLYKSDLIWFTSIIIYITQTPKNTNMTLKSFPSRLSCCRSAWPVPRPDFAGKRIFFAGIIRFSSSSLTRQKSPNYATKEDCYVHLSIIRNFCFLLSYRRVRFILTAFPSCERSCKKKLTVNWLEDWHAAHSIRCLAGATDITPPGSSWVASSYISAGSPASP